MSRNSALGSLLTSFGAHPYLWMLVACLCCQPFLFGTDTNVTSYILSLETILAVGVAAAFGVYVLRSKDAAHPELFIFGIAAVLAGCFVAMQYTRQDMSALVFAVIWAGITAAMCLLFTFFQRHHCAVTSADDQRRINCLIILAAGFLLKLFYVVITSTHTRQHDVYSFGGDSGHAAYIEYILYNGTLPDFDVRSVWQFYHPPLHHAISAAWILFNENILLVGYDAARESLQTLTLFYSMCIIVTAYRILRYFKLKGWALYIPLIIVSFHPAFVIFSGSINNDVLSVVFIMGAILCTLRWYENQTLREIIKIALCVGFGMMTKLSAAIVAPSVALVFLIAFIKKVKSRNHWKRLLIQFLSFLLVCIPLGTWFGTRSYIKWGIPFTYVQELSPTSSQYVGNVSFVTRATDFSAEQFESPYVHWKQERYDNGLTEYNPLVALMKTSVFGEKRLLNSDNSVLGEYADPIALALFWTNVAVAGFALAAMCVVCLRKITVKRTAVLFLASFYVVMLLSYYKMASDYPFTCTMNFRYLSPTAIVGAVFIGLILKSNTNKDPVGAKVLRSCVSIAVFLFAALTEVVYLAIQ